MSPLPDPTALGPALPLIPERTPLPRSGPVPLTARPGPSGEPSELGALDAAGLPQAEIRLRARCGTAAAFPDPDTYGSSLFGADPAAWTPDPIERMRIVPPVFMPARLDRLVELGREPLYRDVELETRVGGFTATVPVTVSAFGSTAAASRSHGIAASTQAARIGIPMVIGENVMPVNSYGRLRQEQQSSLLARITAYQGEARDGYGGVVIQQSTEDADAEVWNMVYTDPNVQPLLRSGRIAFELKVGQGAKPGLGGMTVVGRDSADRLAGMYLIDPVFAAGRDRVLRSSSPGTFTAEILTQQIRLMRNNYPRARIWVKLPPARDVGIAAALAWEAGADAVTVDGAEGGTGWAPRAFLSHVGLPLGECLQRVGPHTSSLVASGRIWEGARATKCLALGASAVGLGRAALLAVDADPEEGLVNLVSCLALELQLLVSALGRYRPADLTPGDLWQPPTQATASAMEWGPC